MNHREYCKTYGKCGRREVVIAAVPYSVEFDDDGQKLAVTVDDLSVPRCANCGTISIDQDAANQITNAIRKVTGVLRPEELRDFRVERGISQDTLAERMAVPLATIQRWETGDQTPSRRADNTLRKLFEEAMPAAISNPVGGVPLANTSVKVG